MKCKAKLSPSGTKQIIMFCLLLRGHHSKMQQYRASNMSEIGSGLFSCVMGCLSLFISIKQR